MQHHRPVKKEEFKEKMIKIKKAKIHHISLIKMSRDVDTVILN
jgi:hypothetical protein